MSVNGVPSESEPLVRALHTHIERTRRIDLLIASVLAILTVAMAVGSWLVYHNATEPGRILKVVDREFAHLIHAQEAQGKQTQADVCSFLRDNHLHASRAVQRDFKCPLNGRHHRHHPTTVQTPPGDVEPTPAAPVIHHHTTVVVHGRHHHHSTQQNPPPSHSPKPTPKPTCTVLSLLGRCLVP